MKRCLTQHVKKFYTIELKKLYLFEDQLV